MIATDVVFATGRDWLDWIPLSIMRESGNQLDSSTQHAGNPGTNVVLPTKSGFDIQDTNLRSLTMDTIVFLDVESYFGQSVV